MGSLAGAEVGAAVDAAAESAARRTAAGTQVVGHMAEVAEAAAGSWHAAWEAHSCATTAVGDARAPARTRAHAGAPRSRCAGTGYP